MGVNDDAAFERDLPQGSGNGLSPEGGPESHLWAAGAGRVHDARTARPNEEYWMYTDANTGKMIGNFTACALLSHEKPSAAAEFRRTYHLDCDP